MEYSKVIPGQLAAIADLRLRLFAHLQRLSIGFYSRNKAGVLVSRMTNDVEALDSLVTDSVVTLFQGGLTLVGTIGILIYLDPRLALLTFAIVPLIGIASLVFRIASGQMFGADQPVVLRMLEIEPAMKALDGLAMELDDCAFPLLHDMVLTSKTEEAFDGTSWALLVGSVPRKAGMERGDLLSVNGGIFGPQGKAIAARAASDVRILVVGNPCNTNCYIARSNAPEIPPERWFAMMRLDENRAMTQLAKKAKVPVSVVTNMAIWGNHSATQYPDARNARIVGSGVYDVITDHGWLKGDFIKTVQTRALRGLRLGRVVHWLRRRQRGDHAAARADRGGAAHGEGVFRKHPRGRCVGRDGSCKRATLCGEAFSVYQLPRHRNQCGKTTSPSRWLRSARCRFEKRALPQLRACCAELM